MSAKEMVIKSLSALPDSSTYDDLLYRVHVLKSIQQGLDQADRGELISHEEFERELEAWQAKPDDQSDAERGAGIPDGRNDQSVTTKRLMISTIEGLPDEASFDAAIDRLTFLRGLEIALKQSDANDVMFHEDFVRELLEEERQYHAAPRVDS